MHGETREHEKRYRMARHILALAVGPARELFHPFANLPLR
jgi:hypothetical protein